MKLEHKLYLNRVEAPDELSGPEQSQLQAKPELRAALAENRALHNLGQASLEPPAREVLLARVYAQATTTQETNMTFIQRLFAGKPLILRLALAAVLLLAIAALSLLLPRAMLTRNGVQLHGGPQPAYAATDGYLLVYDFGDVELASVKAKIEQLTQAVKAFKQAHKMPQESGKNGHMLFVTEEKKEVRTSHAADSGASAGEDASGGKASNHVVVALTLPDDKLLGELQAELSKIDGLPTPKVTDSTWFSEQGLPLPGDDAIKLALNLGQGQHAFNFPKDATPEEMEQAINAWLKQTHPDKTFTVQVEKKVEGDQQRIMIRIKGDTDAAGNDASCKLDMENAGDEIKLTLNFGDITHTFTFPKSASEQQMSEEITAWLAQNYPEHKVKVHVTKSDVDGKTQLMVKIEKTEVESTDSNTGK